MSDETKLALQKLQDAFKKLKEGAEEAVDELDKDGVIQRFEFTFELLWKCLKIHLLQEGIDSKTPRDCLKSAFKIGIIENEAAYLDMLEDRNKTSHIYDSVEAEKIFERVKNIYLPEIEKILTKLKSG